ncbi:MAG: hypothetical protein ACFFG0_41215 [Candidatus Thorarchaeota archaeon]
MKVKLTKNDLKYAEEIACKRNKSQRDGDRTDGKVLEDSLAIDIQGAEAELAVAKAFKLLWDGSFLELDKWFNWRDQGHDVSGLEVRSTHHPKGCLILHPKDKDNSPFILVLTHQRPVFILAGWNIGREGKKSEYWRDVGYGRPCYYLPQNKLRKMNDLEKYLTERVSRV